MKPIRLAVAAAAVLAAIATLLAGCGGPTEVEVTLHTTADAPNHVDVGHGQVLRVNLGETNESIGDAWYVAAEPDSALLRDTGRHLDSHCAANQAGCGATLTWTFAALAPGNTAVAFRYCYRTQLAACAPGPGRGPTVPITLTVTVT